MSKIANLAVEIGADIGPLIRATDRAGGQVDKLGRRTSRASVVMVKAFRNMALAAVAIAGSIAALAKTTMASAEALSDMANKANTSVTALQELRFAATQNGASVRDMDDALTRLSRRMSLFAQDGGGPAAKAIEQLNINIRNADGTLRDSADVFDEITRKFGELRDEATKAALASQLFGEDAGPRLVPLLNQGVSGLEELRRKANDLGLVLDEQGVRTLAAVNAEFRALGQSAGASFQKMIVDNADAFKAMAEAAILVVDVLAKVAGRIAELIGLVAEFGNKAVAVANAVIDTGAFQLGSGGGKREAATGARPTTGSAPLKMEINEFVPAAVTPSALSFGGAGMTTDPTIAMFEQQRIAQEEARAAMLAVEEDFTEKLTGISRRRADAIGRVEELAQVARENTYLSGTTDVLSAMGTFNEKALKLSKVAGAAQALVSTYQGVAEELKKGTFGFASGAAVLARGLALVGAIRGVTSGGSGGGVGGASSIAAQQQPINTSPRVALQLIGSENATFSAGQIRGLINAINEATESGSLVRLV